MVWCECVGNRVATERVSSVPECVDIVDISTECVDIVDISTAGVCRYIYGRSACHGVTATELCPEPEPALDI